MTDLTTQYAAMVTAKKKPGTDIAAQMSGGQADALHMAVGVAGEAGELLDAIKRFAIYQKPLDRANVIEELGDLEFFMEGLRQRLHITREETLESNMTKLGTRYSSGSYSDEEAHARADKEPAILQGGGRIDMKKIVFVFGPMASGKTRNAEKIAKLFGTTRTVDDWGTPAQTDKKNGLLPGDLVLTNVANDARVLTDLVTRLQAIPRGVAVEMHHIRGVLQQLHIDELGG